MARVQLALNVSDLDEAIGFYSKLFGTAPAKVRPGYANFAIADPPLKLVLMEQPETRGAGVGRRPQPPRSGGRRAPTRSPPAGDRLAGEGLATRDQHRTTCCFAVQDKVWVEDPDGARRGRSTRCWPTHRSSRGSQGDGTCCSDSCRRSDAPRAAEPFVGRTHRDLEDR